MKILLVAINSKYIHSNLAVYSLKAYRDMYDDARMVNNNPVEIAEFTINQYVDDIIAGIYEQHPDVVAFSCYIWNIKQVLEVASQIKKLLPKAPILLGGPEVSFDGSNVLRDNSYIDVVMVGEGEQTFLELCQLYEHNEQITQDMLSSIKGLVIREKEMLEGENYSVNYRFTGQRPLLNMDKLPFVYNNLKQFENRIIYYESSRGCPFRCSYCLSSVEKSVRLRSLSLVFSELKFFLENHVSQVKFVDRTFNCNHERTMQLLKFIQQHDNGITNFHFEIAADLLKEDEIELMSKLRPGLIQLEIGVQTINPETLSSINRINNLPLLSSIVRKISLNNNVHQHLDLIAGLPYEDFESFKKSFDYVYSLHPQQLQLGFLKVLKGSGMHENADKYGIVYQDRPPYEVLYTKWISYEEILTLKGIEQLIDVYYNSRQYVNILNYLVEAVGSPFTFYMRFEAFYKKHEYFIIKHSRITRYKILYDFILELYSKGLIKDKNTAVELLITDIYLRENVKTRPEFAYQSTETDKVNMKALYKMCDAPKTSHLERLSLTTVGLLKNSITNWDIAYKAIENSKYVWILFNYDIRDSIDGNAILSIFLQR